MNTNNRRALRPIALIGTALVSVAFLGLAGPVSAGPAESFHGVFNETAAAQLDGYDLHGSAKMTVRSDHTAVKVNIAGLDAHNTYTSHLHNGTCAHGGGSHYQNVEGGAVTPPNELWVTTNGTNLAPNNGGVAHGRGHASWAARTSSAETNALSVVVHAAGGARIACADLR